MAFFNEFPHTRTYDSDLAWLISRMKEALSRMDEVEELVKKIPDEVAAQVQKLIDNGTIAKLIADGVLTVAQLLSFVYSEVINDSPESGTVGLASANIVQSIAAGICGNKDTAILNVNVLYYPKLGMSSSGTAIIKDQTVSNLILAHFRKYDFDYNTEKIYTAPLAGYTNSQQLRLTGGGVQGVSESTAFTANAQATCFFTVSEGIGNITEQESVPNLFYTSNSTSALSTDTRCYSQLTCLLTRKQRT